MGDAPALIEPTRRLKSGSGPVRVACPCGKHCDGACSHRQARPSQLTPPIVHEVLRQPGKPLDPRTRAAMESQFGHDFSHVRVHSDPRAAESALSIDTAAFTVGRHIVLGAQGGSPGPGSVRVLAHELAHVVQQRHVGGEPPDTLTVAPPGSALEHRAAAATTGASELDLGTTGEALVQPMPRDETSAPGSASAMRHGGTLPYREASELADCVRILGDASAAYCRQTVLGEQPPPRPTHHQLPGITTPLPIEVGLNPNQTASLEVNRTSVVFEPDGQSTDQRLSNRAETTFDLSSYAINYVSQGGRIQSFTGPGPVEIRIRTTYGPGASPSGTSGYGRGTTPEDVAAGETSIGFHEGHHGTDFIEFMEAHSFPRFVGANGMTVRQFTEAMASFRTARERWRQDMKRFSELRTDCPPGGKSIDTSNAEHGLRTTICRVARPGHRRH